MLLGEPVEVGRPRSSRRRAGPRPLAATAGRARSSRRAPSRSWRRRPRRAPPSRPCSGLSRRPRPACARVERVAQPVVVPVDLARGLGLARRCRGTRRRSARRGRRTTSTSVSPVGHPLRERLAEPAGAAEAVERQAGGDPEAAARPGIGPSSGLPSGVIASGWQSRRTTPASSRNGNRRIAPSSSGAKRSMSDSTGLAACSHGHAVGPARGRVRLVAADQQPAGLRLARRRGGRCRGSTARRAGSRGRPPPASRRAGGRPAPTGRTRPPSPPPAAPRRRPR